MNDAVKRLSQQWSDIALSRIELIAGFGGMLFFILVVLLFPGIEALALILGILTLGIAIYFGYEYFPLVLIVTLPFSVKIPLMGDTNIDLPSEPLIILIALLWFGYCIAYNRVRYRASWLNPAIGAFLIIIWISLFYTATPIPTVKALIRDTGYLIAGYFLIPMFIRNENRLRTLLVACLVSHTLLALYGLGTQAYGGLRIYGDLAAPFFKEHCIYAAYITFTLAFLLAFALGTPPTIRRTVYWGFTAFFGVAILLTFVRGAWVSIFFLLVYYLIQFRKQRGSVDLVLILIYVLLLGMVVVVGTTLGQMLIQRAETLTDVQYIANYERVGRWLSAIDIWKDHPYFGAGWGSYGDLYFDYIVIHDVWSAQIRMGAHNLYLEYMAEVGVVGLFVFLIVIYLFFRYAISLQMRTQNLTYRLFLIGLQGAMITYLTHAFLNNLGPSDKIGVTFWLFLGMIPTMSVLIEREERERANDATDSPQSHP